MKRIVVITGASRGIGLESARILVNHGYQVYGISRTQPNEFLDDQYIHFSCDLSDYQSLSKAIDKIVEKIKVDQGKLYAIINNAGYAQIGSVQDVSYDLVRKQFEVNVFGLVEVSRRLIPLMKEQHEGKIINISSVVGQFAGPYGGIYAATKHAIEALSASMRMELRRHGIKVIVVNPGLTDTEFHKTAFDSMQQFIQSSSYQRIYEKYLESHKGGGSPLTVANIIADVVSNPNPKSRYVVGRREKLVLIAKKLLPETTFYSLVEKKAKID